MVDERSKLDTVRSDIPFINIFPVIDVKKTTALLLKYTKQPHK